MASSKLVTYERNCNKYNERNHAIDTITIHCYVGQVTAKQGTDYLATTERQVSVNYVCGTDGIGENIPEKYRAWTSSSRENDSRAVTIETACDKTEPYAVRDDVIQRVIDLCVDICQRNNIPKLIWSNNKYDRVNHKNGCNVTFHRDFAATACPGTFLIDAIPNRIIPAVNARLTRIVNKSYTHEEFIEAIASAAKKYKDAYGIKVVSPIIAQAINESGWGTSNKAKHNNYFGLKYRENRVNCHCGTFVDGSSEQNSDGSYVAIKDKWYEFETLEKGVEGYFQFINIDRYKNLKGVTDPMKYVKLIKEDGYATSLTYVDSITKIINTYNLTKYDKNSVNNTDGEIYYRVVTGSYKDKNNAKAQVDKLKKAGFDSFIAVYKKEG